MHLLALNKTVGKRGIKKQLHRTTSSHYARSSEHSWTCVTWCSCSVHCLYLQEVKFQIIPTTVSVVVGLFLVVCLGPVAVYSLFSQS